MNRPARSAWCLAALLPLAGLALAFGQPDPDPGDNALLGLGREISKEHIDTMTNGMAAWMESMQPGKPHELLAMLAGGWEVRASMFMSQDMPPMETVYKGTATSTMGGRFLELRGSGEMMGMSMDSLLIFGYDNVRKLFHLTMYNSMGTGVSTLYGNLDETGRILTFVGPMDEPMSGEVGKSFRVVMTFESADRYSYTIDEILYGEPFTVVRAVATRTAP